MSYSPVLSIITALLEIIVIIWALSGTRRNKITYASCLVLLLLSLYQILEVLVCFNSTGSILFSRLGFLVITWLPAIGLMLVCFLFPYRSILLLRYVQVMLFTAFILNLWILADNSFLNGSVCKIVFAQYDNPLPGALIFGGYYELGLWSMLFISAIGIIKSDDGMIRKKLGQILLGTMAFVLPSMLVVISFPSARGALTSVMCHFAIFLAVFLTRLIYLERKSFDQRSSG